MNMQNTGIFTSEQVLHYWFQGAEKDIELIRARSKIWYSVSMERDEEIKRKFGTLLRQVVDGQLRDWAETSAGVLALVLVLDQFTRQIYRKTAAAFANDALATELVYSAVDRGLDQAMSVPGRLFLYHPLLHSESLADQEFGVELVRNLRNQCEPIWHDYITKSVDYFEEHCEIVRRLGRFPHRNEVLQRSSTQDEIEFLRTASSYGQ